MGNKIQKTAVMLLFIFSLGLSAHEDLRFDYLNAQKGLSHSSVSSITQDPYGFIWLGTQEGLNRFDGENFKIYHHDPYNTNSLSHNLIQTMYQDGDDLWLGTYSGLNLLHIPTEKVTRYLHIPEKDNSLSDEVVVSISNDSDNHLWVGTLNGLNKLHKETGDIVNYFHLPEDKSSLPNNVIRALFMDDQQDLWIGSYGGLSKYLPESDSFVSYNQENNGLPGNLVMDIEQLDHHRLALGIWDMGLVFFDSNTGEWEQYSLSDNRIYSILVEKKTIWVATYGGGLVEFDRLSKKSFLHNNSADSSRPLSNDTCYSLFRDDSGILWVGTNGGGVNRLIPGWDRYEFQENTQENSKLSSGKVQLIYQDKDGYIWAAIYNNGLDRMNPSTDEITHFRHSDEVGSINDDIVNFLFEDSQGRFWVGTNGGLNLYDKEKETFSQNLNVSEIGLEDSSIITYCMEEDSRGGLWLGTYNNGLFYFDAENKRKRHFTMDDNSGLNNNLIRKLLIDRQGTLWVGTNHGINRYDEESNRFTSYIHDENDRKTLSSNIIYDLYEDSQGTLWAGTGGGGLNYFDKEKEGFVWYQHSHDLAFNSVKDIVEDSNGYLWVSTRKGMNRISPDRQEVLSISSSTGFPNVSLSSGLLLDSRGIIHIGSEEGIIRIKDSSKPVPSGTSRLVFTLLNVQGKPYSENVPPYLLTEINMDSGYGLLEFEYAELNYLTALSSSYYYKLEGFDEDWNSAGQRKYGSYSNLPPGKYTLKVGSRFSNQSDITNDISIPVRVMYPKALRFPLWFIYLILILLFISSIITHFVKTRKVELLEIEREKEYHNKLREQVEARTKELDQQVKEKEILASNLEHAIDYAPYPIILYRSTGIIEFLNSAWQESTEIPFIKNMYLNKWIKKAHLVPEKEKQKEMVYPLQGIFNLQSSSGKSMIWDIGSSSLKMNDQDYILYIGIARDITDLRNMELQLRQSEKMSALGQLAGGIAHDFNNQLTGIIGSVDMINASMDEKEKQKYLEEILLCSNSAAELIRKMLLFARKGIHNYSIISLNKVVKESFLIARRSIDKAIELTMDLCEENNRIFGNEAQLQNALLNLILNARDSLNKNGTIKISTREMEFQDNRLLYQGDTLPAGKYLVIKVQDNGSGIPDEIQDHIFEPFFTTKDKNKGTGMGLAAVYGTVKSHRGYIHFESHEGQGTLFKIMIPSISEH